MSLHILCESIGTIVSLKKNLPLSFGKYLLGPYETKQKWGVLITPNTASVEKGELFWAALCLPSFHNMSFTMWEESKGQWGKLAVSEFKSASY